MKTICRGSAVGLFGGGIVRRWDCSAVGLLADGFSARRHAVVGLSVVLLGMVAAGI